MAFELLLLAATVPSFAHMPLGLFQSQQNGAVNRIGTDRGESSRGGKASALDHRTLNVRRSDHLFKTYLRCALQSVY